jgi:hypothetical protein
MALSMLQTGMQSGHTSYLISPDRQLAKPRGYVEKENA